MATKAVRTTYAHNLTQKDIWGQTWQAFMGMATDEGGIRAIQDQPADYTLAVELESYVARCVEIRGRAISQVPLRVWQTQTGGRRAAIEHPAQEILDQTNPYGYVNGRALIRYTLTSIDLHGRSAWKLAFGRDSAPTEIYWQVPTNFTPLPDPNKYLRGIRVISQAGVVEYPREQICYFNNDNLGNPLFGMSKIKVLRNAINLRQYSARSNIDFFKNSMRPDWVLSGDWKNNEETIEVIRRNLRRHYTGESNRQPLVLGEGATAHLITTSNKDAEWLAQQRLSQEEISAVFGVPVNYLNNWDRATYENIKTAKLILWHDTMIPEGNSLSDMFNREFLWRFWPDTKKRNIEFGFDYSSIEGLGEDVALVWERFNNFMTRVDEQVRERVLTPNEARMALEQFADRLGIQADPWAGPHSAEIHGDTHLAPFNNLPVEQLSAQTIIDIEAARSSNPNAAALIEDVPGAPNASANAGKVLQRIDEQLDAQTRVAQARAQQSGGPDKSAQPILIRKGPHPLTVRDARLRPVQDKLARRLKSHFQGLKQQAERTLRGKTGFVDPTTAVSTKAVPPADDPLYDHEASKRALVAILQEGITESASVAYAASAEDFELGVRFADDHPWLSKYMGRRLPLIQGIDDTLRGRLRDALTDSAAAGDSMPAIAEKVRGVFQSAIDSQSETIARTETIQAYGAASLQSYREAGVGQAQMYDGSGDDECASVDGQIVTLSEAEQLMAEEHPNGVRGVAPVIDVSGDDSPDLIAAGAPKRESRKQIFAGVTLVA